MFTLILSAIGLFIGIFLTHELGWYLRRFRFTEQKNDATSAGLLDGAVYGLLGLLLAFTFSGAATRFDHRRELVIQEANAIGTAYLRLDLLPAENQPALRALFRQYLDARMDMTRKMPDLNAVHAAIDQATVLQNQLWPLAVKVCQASGSVATTNLLLAALNEMFDDANLRTTTSFEIHPPGIIFVMLFGLALISSFLSGYTTQNTRKHSMVHVTVFAAMISTTAYVILDIEYPRSGLIRIDSIDKILVDLRKTME